MPADAQALQRGHHEGARQVHGSHCGGHGEDRTSLHTGAEGEDAGARDLPAAWLHTGQAVERASQVHATM